MPIGWLLEVPFFMAAYQFLSAAGELQGASFGPITDLGAPDGLITLGSFTVNVLPVLMTLINVVSSAIYLKGFPLKTKIQLYGMAAFFLVFLYDSPSGLVFYWTLNNLFSLVKTIFYKLKNPRKVGNLLMSVLGIGALVFGLGLYRTDSMTRKLFVVGIGAALQLPLVLSALKGRISLPGKKTEPQPSRKLFTLCCLLLTVLLGFLIPSSVISASAQEFVEPGFFTKPLQYVFYSGFLAAGFFLVWLQVFYWLANDAGKAMLDKIALILCGLMLINYMFFGTDLGLISTSFQFDVEPVFTLREQLVNLLVMAAAGALLFYASGKWLRSAAPIVLTAVIALGSMSVLNMGSILRDTRGLSEAQVGWSGESGEKLQFSLSREGQNVVVIMLDRAIGFLPEYFFQEKPELLQQFAGFTYYNNVVSFGTHTNIAIPPLLGGYEYTPVEMNRRDDLLLVEKHNEALKVMPVLFSREGYDVHVWDAPYMNYGWHQDPTFFSGYPGISSAGTAGAFVDTHEKEVRLQSNRRNLFCYSLMKTVPLILQDTIYAGGSYNQAVHVPGGDNQDSAQTVQTQQSLYTAKGENLDFMESYLVLQNLPGLTCLTDNPQGSYLFLMNDVTHQPTLLQAPDYTPAASVDNRDYASLWEDRTLSYGTLQFPSGQEMMHYHVNMAAFLQLGNWFDFLRREGVYDNTRIILVADHGYWLEMLDTPTMTADRDRNIAAYFPLLMVKDFGATEFIVSDTFMTNADVPAIAAEGIIANPVNPFTGKPLDMAEKTAHSQYISLSHEFSIDVNNGYQYLPSVWAEVSGSVWTGWTYHDDVLTLTDHTHP